MGSNVIHLSDIKRAKGLDEGAAKPQPEVQLDLPFEHEPTGTARLTANLAEALAEPVSGVEGRSDNYIFLVCATDFPFHDDFLNFCKAMSPRLLVDLRVAPRLDFVRPVRKQAFELFEMCGIEYRDVLGRLGATTYDLATNRLDEVVDVVTSLHACGSDGHATVGLFDNATFARSCTSKLLLSSSVSTLDTEAIRRMVAEGARERM